MNKNRHPQGLLPVLMCVLLSLGYFHDTAQADVVVGPGEVLFIVDETVNDNILVLPTGALSVSNSTIKGNIATDNQIFLSIVSDSVIMGYVETQGGGRVFIESSTIDENVSLSGITGNSTASLRSSIIGGNVTISDNFLDGFYLSSGGTPLSLLVAANSVGGDVEITRNYAAKYIAAYFNEHSGNISLTENQSTEKGVTALGNNVIGDLTVSNNLAVTTNGARDNQICGDIIFQDNVAGIENGIRFNTLGGVLSVSGNNPAALVSDNTTGVSCLIPVTIDIKPKSYPNSINPYAGGFVGVAILTTDAFDALEVDYTTVSFGPWAAAPSREAKAKDVDDDGDLDLIFHFKVSETGIACGDPEATLTGETHFGYPVEATDSLVTRCNWKQ